MSRAVAAIESDNLVDLIRDYRHPYWGFAAKNFYAEFLAAVEVGKNVDQYFPDLQLDPALAFQEIELKNSESLVALAKNAGLTRDQLLGWNPALSTQTRLVPAGYRVKVPVDSKAQPVIEVAQSQAKEQPRGGAPSGQTRRKCVPDRPALRRFGGSNSQNERHG